MRLIINMGVDLMTELNIDFNCEPNERPYVDWVSIRFGQLDPKLVEADIAKYDLTIDDLQTMHDVDLDCHLCKYGVDYLIDKHGRQMELQQEVWLSNGGLSDEELRQRFEDVMYGHASEANNSSYDLDY